MTHITVYRNKKEECVGFTAIGHAGYAVEGEDIVCAAISVLLINTVNSIEAFTGEEFGLVTNEEEGLLDCRLKNEPSEQTNLLFSAMILGIRNLAEENGQYIQLTFEEV